MKTKNVQHESAVYLKRKNVHHPEHTMSMVKYGGGRNLLRECVLSTRPSWNQSAAEEDLKPGKRQEPDNKRIARVLIGLDLCLWE